MHPAHALRGTKSRRLSGRQIVLGITGSIAAVETVKLARELIRHGAEVHAVFSEEAEKIVHPEALRFATGHDVTTVLDGRVQHVSLCGDVEDRADLLLIAPATANTISKIACGIDDSPVTTVASTALGTGIPLLIVPAMHGTMYRHPIVQQNIAKLKEIGVEFVEPVFEEHKAKLAELETVVEAVLRRLGPLDLAGRRVLVIAGATREPLDEVRVLTNRSSGRTGIELAKAAYERGAAVELWAGHVTEQLPAHVAMERFETAAELAGRLEATSHDIVLVPAAISDYAPPRQKGKISSKRPRLQVTLQPTPKVLPSIRAKLLVAFKAEAGVGRAELVRRAKGLLSNRQVSFVVANDVRQVTEDRTEVLLVSRRSAPKLLRGPKSEVAHGILDAVVRAIR